jgi:hypothetical protein
MPENLVLKEHSRLSRITEDIACLAQFLTELQEITAAAREVVWQRYNTDPGDKLGYHFPGVSLAISELSNLVGVLTTAERGAKSPQTDAANRYPRSAK